MSKDLYDIEAEGGFDQEVEVAGNVYAMVSVQKARAIKAQMESDFLAESQQALLDGDLDTVREALSRYAAPMGRVLAFIEENS